jgi:hypothetical protein
VAINYTCSLGHASRHQNMIRMRNSP